MPFPQSSRWRMLRPISGRIVRISRCTHRADFASLSFSVTSFSMLSVRKTIRLTSWPDPLLQERIEEVGFFFARTYQGWVRFAEEPEVESVSEWLKRHRLTWQILPAQGRSELKRHPRLSDELLLKNG